MRAIPDSQLFPQSDDPAHVLREALELITSRTRTPYSDLDRLHALIVFALELIERRGRDKGLEQLRDAIAEASRADATGRR